MLTINKDESKTNIGPRALKVLRQMQARLAAKPYLLARFIPSVQNEPLNANDINFRFESLAALDDFTGFYCKKLVPHPKFTRMWYNHETGETWVAVDTRKVDYAAPWQKIAESAA